MTEPSGVMPAVAVVARDDPRHPAVRYHDELHPDDAGSLDALLASSDIAEANAILRWSDQSRRWRLVDHHVQERRPDGVVVLLREDVTGRERALGWAGRTEAYWRTVLRNGHESIAIIDPADLTITHASDRLAQLLGVGTDALTGSRALWHVDRRDLREVRKLAQEWDRGQGPLRAELRLRNRGADAVWVEIVLSDACDDPAVAAYVVNLREIGERKRAEERLHSSEHLFSVLVHHLADGVIVADRDGRIAFVSDRAAEALGSGVEELRNVVVPLVTTATGLRFGGSRRPGHFPPFHLLPAELRGPDGRWFHLVGHDLSDDPIVAGWVLVMRDVTDGRTRVERLRQELEEDPLTGLLNRRGFEARLDVHLTAGETVGVGFLDLDGFKAVNDRFGHANGDALLRAVAGRLRRCVRPGDEVARFGGDEFVVAFVNLPSDRELVHLTNRVVAAVAGTYSTVNGPVEVGVSAGWSVATPGMEVHDALRRADHRMYEQKRRQR